MNWLYDRVGDVIRKLRGMKYVRDDFFRVADEYPGFLPIEILKGTYKGTVYAIKSVNVLDDYGKVKYDFDILKPIPGKHKSYYGDGFYKLVGELLCVCLDEFQANRVNLRNEVMADDADDIDYLEESTPPRAISKKSTTIPPR